MRGATLFVTTALVLASRAASAQEEAARPRPELHLAGHVGGFGASDGGGPMVGFSLLYRYDALAAGAALDLGASFGSTMYGLVSASALAGVAGGDRGPGWRGAWLAKLGVDHYGGYGAELLGSDPGGDATLPMAGCRFWFAHRWRRFELGALMDVDVDLGRSTITNSFADTGGIFGPPSQPGALTATHTAGSERIGLMLVLGGALDP